MHIYKYDRHTTEIEIWNIDIVLNINYHEPCPMYILCIYIYYVSIHVIVKIFMCNNIFYVFFLFIFRKCEE